MKMKMRRRVRRVVSAGQTLIEVLVITILVGSILTAIASVVVQSLKNTAETKRQALATDLAQQGLEVYRQRRQSLGWASFQTAAASATYCLNTLPTSDQEFAALVSGGCGDDTAAGTEFTRQAEVTSSASEVQVTINVTWQADQIKTVSVSQNFHDIDN